MSNRNGPTYCEVCGEPGDFVCTDGWCCCTQHVHMHKTQRRYYWWRTGEELDERGVAPSMIRSGPRSRFDFQRPFCEVCGTVGPSVSVEGWSTCNEHFRSPKPAVPLFDWRTGVRLGPYEDLPNDEQPGEFLPLWARPR